MRALACLLLAAAAARAGGPVKAEHVEAELVAEHTSVRPGATARLGLRLRLDPKWHVYWRNPGDSGQAPAVAWTLPEGVTAGPIRWPAPIRIPAGPFVTFGYEGELLLPVDVAVPAGFAGPLRLRADVSWLVCERVCLPGEVALDLELPVTDNDPEPDPRWRGLFEAARARLPRAPPPGAVEAVRAGGKVRLRVRGEDATAVFFPDADGTIRNAAPQPVTRGAGFLEIELAPPEGKDPPGRLAGVLALDSTVYALDLAVGAGTGGAAGLSWMLIAGLVLVVLVGGYLVAGRRT